MAPLKIGNKAWQNLVGKKNYRVQLRSKGPGPFPLVGSGAGKGPGNEVAPGALVSRNW